MSKDNKREIDAKITFCVTSAEKQEIEKEAYSQDLTVSRFIRGIYKIWKKYQQEHNGDK